MLKESSFEIQAHPEEMPEVIMKNCIVRLIGPRIIENLVKEGGTIDVEDVHAIKKTNEQLCPEGNYAVLVTSTNFNSITAAARRITSSSEFVKRSLGKAMLVHNTATKLVAEFYIRVNKPAMPTQIFTDRKKAIDWLKELTAEN